MIYILGILIYIYNTYICIYTNNINLNITKSINMNKLILIKIKDQKKKCAMFSKRMKIGI